MAASLGFRHEGEFSPAKLGLNLGGELVLMITPHLGVGLGAGVLSAAKNSAIEWTGGGDSGEIRHSIKASAVPIRLSFYYVFPTSTKMNVFLNAGLGAYAAQAKYSITWDTDGFPPDTQELDVSRLGLGFHGGLGLEYALSPMFGIVAEFAGRLASFSGFEGESRNGGTESGTLYYAEARYGSGTYASLGISDAEPSGPGLSDVREAKISFTGFSFTAGFFVRF